MKQIIQKLWMAMAMLCLTISASAYDFEVDGIQYDITSFTDLTVKAISLSSDSTKNVVIPNVVSFNGRSLSVTELGDSFASDNSLIKTVSVGENIKTIPNNAFRNCISLEKADIRASLNISSGAFLGCESLTEIIFSDNIIRIDSNAFSGCSKLESIQLPESLAILGEAAFKDCAKLNNVNINNVEEINSFSFSGCKSLSEIKLSNNLAAIGRNAFEGTAFETFIIPNSVSSIGPNVFNDCTCLKSVTLGNGITYLPQCFLGCVMLSYVRFEDGDSFISMAPGNELYAQKSYSREQYIYKGYFSDTNVKKIYLGRNFENYTSSPSNWQDIFSNPFIGASNIEEIKIGSLVNTLPSIKDKWFNTYGTFECCSGLKKIELGSALETISNYCFKDCTSLDSISIPNKVKQIPFGTFAGCTNLSFISFGYYCEEISSSAFNGIEALQTINFYGVNPPKYSGTFSNKEYILTKIFVPKNSKSKYEDTTPWSNFWNITEDANLLAYFTIGGIRYEVLANHNVQIIDTELTEISNILLTKNLVYNDMEFILTNILQSAFTGNEYIQSIVIPEGIVEIKDNQFDNCIHLNEVILPSELTTIGDNAFRNCNTLTDINFPNTVKSIGINCFNDCKSLITIDLSRCNINTVPPSSFENCEKLSLISLPSMIQTIGPRAFYGCKSLLNVDLEEVESIGDEAFSHCSSITSLNIPKSCMVIGNGVFDGLNNLKTMKIEQCSSPIVVGHSNDLTLSNTITPFPNPSDVDERRTGFRNGYYDGLFYGLPLERVIINRDIVLPKYYERTVGRSTSSYSTVYNDIIFYPPFYGLTKLKYVEIGEDVSAICKNQIEAVVNAVPTSMEYTNFGKCDNIEMVVSNNPIAPIGGGFSQNVYESAPLFLPNGGEASYKNDEYWKRFSNMNGSKYIPVTSISFESEEITMDFNEQKELMPAINPQDASIKKLKWNSSASNIVEVSDDGVITSKARNGEAVITASACDGSGISQSIRITVEERTGLSEITLRNNLKVLVENGQIVISGKSDSEAVEIYNVQGQKLISTNQSMIEVPSKGIFIVKIGSTSTKVIL